MALALHFRTANGYAIRRTRPTLPLLRPQAEPRGPAPNSPLVLGSHPSGQQADPSGESRAETLHLFGGSLYFFSVSSTSGRRVESFFEERERQARARTTPRIASRRFWMKSASDPGVDALTLRRYAKSPAR